MHILWKLSLLQAAVTGHISASVYSKATAEKHLSLCVWYSIYHVWELLVTLGPLGPFGHVLAIRNHLTHLPFQFQLLVCCNICTYGTKLSPFVLVGMLQAVHDGCNRYVGDSPCSPSNVTGHLYEPCPFPKHYLDAQSENVVLLWVFSIQSIVYIWWILHTAQVHTLQHSLIRITKVTRRGWYFVGQSNEHPTIVWHALISTHLLWRT